MFVKHKYRCSGCRKEEECFFPSEKFRAELRYWCPDGYLLVLHFCGLKCLKKYLSEVPEEIWHGSGAKREVWGKSSDVRDARLERADLESRRLKKGDKTPIPFVED